MSSNQAPIANTAPYLSTSRSFPTDASSLQQELTKAYIETASAVNLREIAQFDMAPIITGQQWFSSSMQQKNQALRQVYRIASLPNTTSLAVPHNIPATATTVFTHIYGVGNNMPTESVPIPFVDVTTPANDITLYVDGTNINIATGADWSAYSAIIVLEYILNAI
jgi:hypothetical protein